MEFTNIPNLNQKVCRIGLGTWAIGGLNWGGTDEGDAMNTIHQAFDQGINLIDTAPVYGYGKSEEIIGKALKTYGKRDQIVLATKVGLDWKRGTVVRDSSRKRILQEIEDSLSRLQVDYIDLYQVHWPDPLVPISETAEVMKGLLEQGKIKAIGVSNFSADQMDEFLKIAPLHVCQSPFNIFESEIKNNVLQYDISKKISTLGYGTLCRGLLSGKMERDTHFKQGDLRNDDPKFKGTRYIEYLKCVEILEDWAQAKYKKPITALAARWSLDNQVNVALWGARKPEQLKLVDSVWGWKLTDDDLRDIAQIVAEAIPDGVGPEFMAPPSEKILEK